MFWQLIAQSFQRSNDGKQQILLTTNLLKLLTLYKSFQDFFSQVSAILLLCYKIKEFL